MSVPHRTRSDPAGQDTAQAPAGPAAQHGAPAPAEARAGSRTRLSTAWVSIWTATVVFIALIVFMLQNTRSVEVSFLWMRGSVPLALALLVAGVGVAILAMAVGGARVGQLRRLARRQPMSPTVSDAVQTSYTTRSPASPEASPSAGGKDST